MLYFCFGVLGCDCGANTHGLGDVGHDGSGTRDVGSTDSRAGDGSNTDGSSGRDSAQSDTSDDPEVCDGIDNDGNGKVDDLDLEGDGICDCLRIGTLGIPGKWGAGEVFDDWVNGKSDDDVVHLTPAPDDPEITAALLEHLQVIVVQDVSVLNAFSDAEVKAINDWINAGGGLMTLIGYGDSNERINVNKILAPASIGYDSAQILPGDTHPVDDSWNAGHPTAMNISSIGMDNGYEVDDMNGQGTVVATEEGLVIAVAKSHGDGKIFVWGDEWITYNSEWNNANYQVEQFWINVINWLTPQKACEIDVIIVD